MSPKITYLGLAGRLAAKEARVGQRLPYAGHVDERTIRTRDGNLVQILHLQGLSFETRTDDELNYRKILRETLLRGIAISRLAIYHHVIRREVSPQLVGQPETPFGLGLDEAWKDQLNARRLFVNDLYLTLVHRPLQGEAGLIEKLFGRGQGEASLAANLRNLNALRESVQAALAPYGPRLLTTIMTKTGTRSEPAEVLANIVNAASTKVLAPSGDLGEAIATRRLNFGADAMEFAPSGAQPSTFGAIVSIKDYPAKTIPGLLDPVLRLPYEMVLSESFVFLDRPVALGRMNLALRRLRAADDDAFSLRNDLMAARDDLGAGRTVYGEHHLSILVQAEDLASLDLACADVQSALGESGIIAVRELVNLEPAFWAQFPSNFQYIARKALISAANFSSLASLHSHPRGQTRDLHWGAPVTVLESTASGPYNFSFHNGDLGNFTVIGPSGSGKTALLNFLAAQAEKFHPRTVIFDKDRGAEAFVRASGGRYDRLSPGEPSGLNPLKLPDTAENRLFLRDWLSRLLTREGLELDPGEQATIADAVDALYQQAPELRQLVHVRDLLQGTRRPVPGDLAARLAPWIGQGEHAWLFDNGEDRIDLSARMLGVDMTRLLDSPVLRTPAMMYLFHCIEQSLDGTPSIIIVDEGWKALDDEVFVRRIRDWQKTIRKRNGILGFCTQSASDALDSKIASAIVEQSATQIFFPNSKARPQDYVDGFGLTEHEFELVRTLPDTSRCFLIKQADHSVVARLDLSNMPGYLRVLAGTERNIRALDGLRERLGDDPTAWLETFMSNSNGGRA